MILIIFIFLILTSLNSFAQSDTSVVLDGSKSLRTSVFVWKQIDGKHTKLLTPDSSKCKIEGLKEGKYEYELTCINSVGEDKDTATVTVIKSQTSGLIIDTTITEQIATTEIKSYSTSSNITMRVKSAKEQKISCTLYDIIGRRLMKAELKVERGVNLLTIPKPVVKGVIILSFITDSKQTFSNEIFIQ